MPERWREMTEREVRRSDRRRTLGLTVERGGSLILSAPRHVPDARLERFAKEKRFWVYQKLVVSASSPPALRFETWDSDGRGRWLASTRGS